MTRRIVLSLALAAPLVAASAAPAVVSDPASHTVSFTATSTDCGIDTDLEFLFVGPDSDRAYEAMFVTDAKVSEIAAAFDAAGIPRGVPFDPAECILWPSGEMLEMEPSVGSLVRETRGEATPPVVWTGGKRLEGDAPEAETEMPSAVFALYNCAQSLLQLDDSLDQSPTYGRFKPAVKIPQGERRMFTFRWNGRPSRRRVEIEFAPGGLKGAMERLKDESSKGPIEALCRFSPDLTVSEAGEIALALSMVDSRSVKINGHAPGQLFYRAYLPLEKWRDRHERLAQPPEVHFLPDGALSVVEVLEDWSDPDSLDPKLSEKATAFSDAGKAAEAAGRLSARTSTMLLYAPADMRLRRVFDFRSSVPGTVLNWYLFRE